MCGIVGAASGRDVTPILIDGLKRLEYRGYDSAGLAVIDQDSQLTLRRSVGRVASLENICDSVNGQTGIAHTRWATHGRPAEHNAHPHTSSQKIAVVHNGIIENHQELRANQKAKGFPFSSETDTEVIVHQIDWHTQQGLNLFDAVHKTIKELKENFSSMKDKLARSKKAEEKSEQKAAEKPASAKKTTARAKPKAAAAKAKTATEQEAAA